MKLYQSVLLCIASLFLIFSCKRLKGEDAAFKEINTYLNKANIETTPDSVKISYIDSVYNQLPDFKNDSLTRATYNKTALAYYNLSNYNKALKTAGKSFSLAIDATDSITMARSLYISGISYYEQSYKDSAFAAYQHAEKIYASLKDPDLGRIILYKAYIYYDIGEYVLCETEAFKALRKLQEQNVNTEIYNCYNLIASALGGQENNEDAIKYFELALKQLEKFKAEGYSDETINAYEASCYNNMGRVYVKMKKYNKAIEISKKGLAFNDVKTGSPALYAKLLNNLAYSQFKKGDYKNLPLMFFESLKIRDSIGNTAGMVASRINIGEYYIAIKDTQKGIDYLKRAYRDAIEIKSSNDMLTSLKLLADVDKAQSGYYSEKYIKLNDSLQQKATQNRNRFARIEYETDRLVTEKEELARKNTIIIGMAVIAILLVAAIFIIYYLNSRNKELLHIQEQQKANEEIYQLMFEQQGKVENARAEEKNRIAMELHDGILNNIYAVRLNLEFTNKKTDEKTIETRKGYIKELQQVETEIRAVSHDLNRNIAFSQDKSFENILTFMITSQKNNYNTEFSAHTDASINWEIMPNTHKVNIYRIIQEALQNVNKYAKAKNALVNITSSDHNIAIIIQDNGAGFDTNAAAAGIGLKNLKKRTEALHGTINIESSIGNGTTIKIEFPVVT